MTNQLQQHPQRRAVDVRIPAIEKYSYCLCLHVKPTTIFIAVFKLINALLFASILLNSEFTVNDQANDIGFALEERHKSTTAAANILARIIMASVSAVGIYAVISGRAALLMPLYAILLVDFFFALPAFYNRDPNFADNIGDYRNYSHDGNQYARYSIMLFSTISMIVKIYFLCVIWKCYRYLRLIELVSPIRLAEFYPHIHQNGHQYPVVRVLGSADSTTLSTGHNMAPPPYESITSNMKPPNYEEAIKSTNTSFPNNPNALIQQQQQQQQQQTVVIDNPNNDENGPHSTIAIANLPAQVDSSSRPVTENVVVSLGLTNTANMATHTVVGPSLQDQDGSCSIDLKNGNSSSETITSTSTSTTLTNKTTNNSNSNDVSSSK